MVVSLLLAALAAPTPPLAAYPIPPAPLRVLCETSDLILVATVGPTRPSPDPDVWQDSIVRLAPLEALHGELPGGPVDVRYSPFLLCPAPASYEAGERVLAFLSLGDDGWYRTVSLSYGTKYPDDQGLAAYGARIRELDELEASRGSETYRLERTVEWLVRCAEHPATRWDGVSELIRSAPRRSSVGEGQPHFGSLLTRGHRERLLEAFLASKDLHANTTCLMPLFTELQDERIELFLLERLREVQGAPRWNVLAAVQELARRRSTPDSEATASAFEQAMRNHELAKADPAAYERANAAALDSFLSSFD